MPIRWRVVFITVGTLAIALVLSGILTLTVLRSTLITHADDQLKAVVKVISTAPSNLTIGMPSNFALRIDHANGLREEVIPVQYESHPDFDACALLPSGSFANVGSKSGFGQWRCLRVLLPGLNIAATIVLPLDDVDRTSAGMANVLIVSGLGLALLGGLGAYLMTQRALRPLRDIERTAATIASGDLTERITTAPVNTEVGSLGASLNVMLARIASAFAARTESEARMRQFVADASHELRTPLAAVRGYGELYRMGAIQSQEELDDTMGRIEQSATRLGVLVEDLLHLARLDNNEPPTLTDVDLLTLACDGAADAAAIDQHRRIRVTGLQAETAPSVIVRGDAARLQQVVMNLVSNVLAHTPSTADLTIAVGQDGDFGVLEVRDTGPGIPAADRQRVFERFYRLDASRSRSQGGAGLGMAIVAAIVGSHGGTVELASPPLGTQVVVRIPLP